MAWISVGIAAIGVGTSLYGASQARGAGKDAEALGAASASYILEETAEEARRLRFRQARTRGTSRAVISASGFRSGAQSMGASSKAYLKTLKDVQGKELAWLQRSGESRADIARRGGQTEGVSSNLCSARSAASLLAVCFLSGASSRSSSGRWTSSCSRR